MWPQLLYEVLLLLFVVAAAVVAVAAAEGATVAAATATTPAGAGLQVGLERTFRLLTQAAPPFYFSSMPASIGLALAALLVCRVSAVLGLSALLSRPFTSPKLSKLILITFLSQLTVQTRLKFYLWKLLICLTNFCICFTKLH
jgi:hypothetical protein